MVKIIYGLSETIEIFFNLNKFLKVFPYWLSLVDYLKLKAFVELTLTDDVRIGIQQVYF